MAASKWRRRWMLAQDMTDTRTPSKPEALQYHRSMTVVLAETSGGRCTLGNSDSGVVISVIVAW